MAEKPTYKVIEPTFEVEGGTPAEALEHVLNEEAGNDYHLLTTARVRGAVNGQADKEWVHVLILGKRDT